MEFDDPADARGSSDVRVRLPRGQLRHGRHPGRSPSRGARRRTSLDTIAYRNAGPEERLDSGRESTDDDSPQAYRSRDGGGRHEYCGLRAVADLSDCGRPEIAERVAQPSGADA